MRKDLLILTGAVALFGLVSSASAVVVLDFGDGGSPGPTGTGTMTCLNVACTQMSGSGIAIDTLTVAGTASKDGTYDVFGAVTPGEAAEVGKVASLDFNTMTNTISITGGVCGSATPDCNGGAGTIVGGTTLLTGAFSSFAILDNQFLAGFSGAGPDTKSPLLLAALGIPTSTLFSHFGFSIGFNLSGTGSPYKAISDDIINISVPEPASILLLGTALVGITQLLRRRTARN